MGQSFAATIEASSLFRTVVERGEGSTAAESRSAAVVVMTAAGSARSTLVDAGFNGVAQRALPLD